MKLVSFDKAGNIIFNSNNPNDQNMLLRARNDLAYFAKVFLPDIFTDKFTSQHLQVCKMLDDDSLAKIAICAWRGFGKSTLFFALALRNLLFRKSKFILYVGSNHDIAMQATEDIKIELCNNDLITSVFGSMKPVYDTNDIKLGFSKKAYFVCDPDTSEPVGYVLPKGAGQVVRGVSTIIGKYGKCRPDLVCVDDIETDEAVMSDEIRFRIRKWFNSALVNVVNTRKQPVNNRWTNKSYWRIIVLDSMKHPDCLIRNLRDNSEFEYYTCPRAIFKDGQWYSAVPEIISDEQIRTEIEQSERYNRFDLYAMEMLGQENVNQNTIKIAANNFRYYSENSLNFNASNVIRLITVDPARSLTGKSFTAITAVAIDTKEHKIYFRDQLVDRIPVAEQFEYIDNFIRQYNAQFLAIEITGADDYLKKICEEEILRRNLEVRLVYLKPTRANEKEIRCNDLIRLYLSGIIYHEDKLRGKMLETELLSYPNNKTWDAIDSAGFTILFMQNMDIHFEQFETDMQNNDTIKKYRKNNIIRFDYRPIRLRMSL